VINYHIFSSIWSSIKNEYNVCINNSSWLLGNGDDIIFRTDPWCGESLINTVVSSSLDINAKVSKFIIASHWDFDQEFVREFPHLPQLIQQVTIATHQKQDELVWNNSNTGSLT